jgi:hypothetical protein
MSSNYLTDVRHFLTHNDVPSRESMDGFSALLGAGVIMLVVGLAVWWRRTEA